MSADAHPYRGGASQSQKNRSRWLQELHDRNFIHRDSKMFFLNPVAEDSNRPLNGQVLPCGHTFKFHDSRYISGMWRYVWKFPDVWPIASSNKVWNDTAIGRNWNDWFMTDTTLEWKQLASIHIVFFVFRHAMYWRLSIFPEPTPVAACKHFYYAAPPTAAMTMRFTLSK